MRCPICHRPLAEVTDLRHRPFCSARCRLVDLSKWLGGDYVIAGPPALDGPLVGSELEQE